jgi:hypothetical protein
MPTDENIAFSKRLKLALTRNPKRITTAAELALQFNLRHPKASITQQAAQKWLTGQAKPTPDKVETLGTWLNVSTHWLLYGPPVEKRRQVASKVRQTKTQAVESQQSDAEIHLATQFRKLSEHQRKLISDLVDQLVLDREAWPGT